MGSNGNGAANNAAFRNDVMAGLASTPKELPSKYLYDERGSKLFDRICELEEYYPTRTELDIMRGAAGEIARLIGPEALVIEYGSGSSLKTPLLLGKLESPVGYIPIDISHRHLMDSAAAIAARFPSLEVLPVCADYCQPFDLPQPRRAARRRVVYFPGSTIGNFHPEEAIGFLRRIGDVCGRDGALLIGVDLRKDRRTLEAAYNDSQRVTEEFSKNLLRRINRELQSDLNPAAFAHQALFNENEGRIEMHLVSKVPQTVNLSHAEFRLHRGESIITEYSYKYELDEFAGLAGRAGFRVERVWSDPRAFFSVQYLVPN